MTRALFVDASAVLAVLLQENDADLFIHTLASASEIYICAVGKYEIVTGLCRARKNTNLPVKPTDFEIAYSIAESFIKDWNMQVLPIGDREAALALNAYQNYGKGTGAKANLNMGDCFSYACSKSLSAPLLFKGNDFIHTDIAQA